MLETQELGNLPESVCIGLLIVLVSDSLCLTMLSQITKYLQVPVQPNRTIVKCQEIRPSMIHVIVFGQNFWRCSKIIKINSCDINPVSPETLQG